MFEQYKEQISDSLQVLQSGDVFIVRDLFVGCKFDKIEEIERMHLGRQFYEEVKNGHLSAEALFQDCELEKTSLGQQKYKKI